MKKQQGFVSGQRNLILHDFNMSEIAVTSWCQNFDFRFVALIIPSTVAMKCESPDSPQIFGEFFCGMTTIASLNLNHFRGTSSASSHSFQNVT